MFKLREQNQVVEKLRSGLPTGTPRGTTMTGNNNNISITTNNHQFDSNRIQDSTRDDHHQPLPSPLAVIEHEQHNQKRHLMSSPAASNQRQQQIQQNQQAQPLLLQHHHQPPQTAPAFAASSPHEQQNLLLHHHHHPHQSRRHQQLVSSNALRRGDPLMSHFVALPTSNHETLVKLFSEPDVPEEAERLQKIVVPGELFAAAERRAEFSEEKFTATFAKLQQREHSHALLKTQLTSTEEELERALSQMDHFQEQNANLLEIERRDKARIKELLHKIDEIKFEHEETEKKLHTAERYVSELQQKNVGIMAKSARLRADVENLSSQQPNMSMLMMCRSVGAGAFGSGVFLGTGDHQHQHQHQQHVQHLPSSPGTANALSLMTKSLVVGTGHQGARTDDEADVFTIRVPDLPQQSPTSPTLSVAGSSSPTSKGICPEESQRSLCTDNNNNPAAAGSTSTKSFDPYLFMQTVTDFEQKYKLKCRELAKLRLKTFARDVNASRHTLALRKVVEETQSELASYKRRFVRSLAASSSSSLAGNSAALLGGIPKNLPSGRLCTSTSGAGLRVVANAADPFATSAMLMGNHIDNHPGAANGPAGDEHDAAATGVTSGDGQRARADSLIQRAIDNVYPVGGGDEDLRRERESVPSLPPGWVGEGQEQQQRNRPSRTSATNILGEFASLSSNRHEAEKSSSSSVCHSKRCKMRRHVLRDQVAILELEMMKRFDFDANKNRNNDNAPEQQQQQQPQQQQPLQTKAKPLGSQRTATTNLSTTSNQTSSPAPSSQNTQQQQQQQQQLQPTSGSSNRLSAMLRELTTTSNNKNNSNVSPSTAVTATTTSTDAAAPTFLASSGRRDDEGKHREGEGDNSEQQQQQQDESMIDASASLSTLRTALEKCSGSPSAYKKKTSLGQMLSHLAEATNYVLLLGSDAMPDAHNAGRVLHSDRMLYAASTAIVDGAASFLNGAETAVTALATLEAAVFGSTTLQEARIKWASARERAMWVDALGAYVDSGSVALRDSLVELRCYAKKQKKNNQSRRYGSGAAAAVSARKPSFLMSDDEKKEYKKDRQKRKLLKKLMKKLKRTKSMRRRNRIRSLGGGDIEDEQNDDDGLDDFDDVDFDDEYDLDSIWSDGDGSSVSSSDLSKQHQKAKRRSGKQRQRSGNSGNNNNKNNTSSTNSNNNNYYNNSNSDEGDSDGESSESGTSNQRGRAVDNFTESEVSSSPSSSSEEEAALDFKTFKLAHNIYNVVREFELEFLRQKSGGIPARSEFRAYVGSHHASDALFTHASREQALAKSTNVYDNTPGGIYRLMHDTAGKLRMVVPLLVNFAKAFPRWDQIALDGSEEMHKLVKELQRQQKISSTSTPASNSALNKKIQEQRKESERAEIFRTEVLQRSHPRWRMLLDRLMTFTRKIDARKLAAKNKQHAGSWRLDKQRQRRELKERDKISREAVALMEETHGTGMEMDEHGNLVAWSSGRRNNSNNNNNNATKTGGDVQPSRSLGAHLRPSHRSGGAPIPAVVARLYPGYNANPKYESPQQQSRRRASASSRGSFLFGNQNDLQQQQQQQQQQLHSDEGVEGGTADDGGAIGQDGTGRSAVGGRTGSSRFRHLEHGPQAAMERWLARRRQVLGVYTHPATSGGEDASEGEQQQQQQQQSPARQNNISRTTSFQSNNNNTVPSQQAGDAFMMIIKGQPPQQQAIVSDHQHQHHPYKKSQSGSSTPQRIDSFQQQSHSSPVRSSFDLAAADGTTTTTPQQFTTFTIEDIEKANPDAIRALIVKAGGVGEVSKVLRGALRDEQQKTEKLQKEVLSLRKTMEEAASEHTKEDAVVRKVRHQLREEQESSDRLKKEMTQMREEMAHLRYQLEKANKQMTRAFVGGVVGGQNAVKLRSNSLGASNPNDGSAEDLVLLNTAPFPRNLLVGGGMSGDDLPASMAFAATIGPSNSELQLFSGGSISASNILSSSASTNVASSQNRRPVPIRQQQQQQQVTPRQSASEAFNISKMGPAPPPSSARVSTVGVRNRFNGVTHLQQQQQQQQVPLPPPSTSHSHQGPRNVWQNRYQQWANSRSVQI